MTKDLNKITIKCSSCKSEYTFLSTVESVHIEICSGCHPFYTGKETLVDTDNRLQKFTEKQAKGIENSQQRMSKKERLIAKKSSSSNQPRQRLSLKDMLASIK
jgi:large subunit ribosomal protein L31